MKKFLAIDTAGASLCVALHTGRQFSCPDFRAASEKLMPAVDALLRAEDLSVRDLDYIACVTGPGSFTGIRIGVSAVRALCCACNLPAVPLHALRTLAYNKEADGRAVLCLSDASNGFAYVQAFDHTRAPLGACEALPLKQAVARAAAYEGAVCADSVLCAHLPHAVRPASDASVLLRAAAENAQNAVPYTQLLPEYVRLSQAEETYLERMRNA